MDNLKQPALNQPAGQARGQEAIGRGARVGDEGSFLRRLLGNLEKGTPASIEQAKLSAENRLKFITVRSGNSGK